MLDVVFRLLGNVEVLGPLDGRRFPARGFQVLSILALAPSRKASRRKIADLLWESSNEAKGLANLRQLLARMRRVPAAEKVIGADEESLWLTSNAHLIDVCAFLDLEQSESLPETLQSLALFGGDLLCDVTDVSDGFQHWLGVERSALRERFFGAATKVLMEMTRYGNARPEELGDLERRLLRVEPEREASYRALIEAYGRNGMRHDALRLYEALQEALRNELGASVSPETRGIMRRVAATSATEIVSTALQADPSEGRRVAFLPIRRQFGPSNPDLFDALIDDVANILSRYRTLTVLAPHSSYQFAAKSGVMKDLAAHGVDYFVSGYVPPGQPGLVDLRLQKASTGEILWAAEYSERREHLFESFRLLSRQIASSLAETIERRRETARMGSCSAEAYAAFLLGKTHLSRTELPLIRRARLAFKTATEHLQEFSSAHARIAQTLYLEWLLLGGGDPALLVAARREADFAIGIDPGDGEGHWMRGVVSLYQRDFDGSANHFAVAESLNPNSPDLLVQYGDALSHLGRPDEGWRRFEKAIELNPLPPDHYWWAGASIAFYRGDYEQSVKLGERIAAADNASRLLAASHALNGDLVKARFYGRRARELFPAQSGADIGSVPPNRNPEFGERFREGLRLAGIT